MLQAKFATILLLAVAGGSALIRPVTAGASTSAARIATQEPSDFTFTLNRVPENPRQYSLVISNSEERSISGSFSVDQLQILRAIMVEGEKFALSEEGVNVKEPVTTRFADKYEQSFIVDVQKIGNQSVLYLTLNTALGRMTVDAGKFFRSTRRKEGFFFDLLSRLESLLPKLPAQPGK